MSQYFESYNPASNITNKFSFGNTTPGTGLVRNSTGTFSFPTSGEDLAFKFDAQKFNDDLSNSLNTTTPWATYANYGLAGLQTLTGLANAYLGYKNYKLAKDQFGFEKAAINRNIANQAKQINSAYDSSASIAAAMQGTDANGVLRPEIRERYMNEAKNRHVDGSKIG